MNPKFRAWDKENKRWCHEAIALDHEGHFTVLYDYASNIGDDVDIQMFTGLRDKNGKEIYEGDIVRSEHNNESSEIRFGEYTYEDDQGPSYRVGFYWYENGENENEVDKGCGLGHDQDYSTNKFEVIGNIYENPGLLNPGGTNE